MESEKEKEINFYQKIFLRENRNYLAIVVIFIFIFLALVIGRNEESYIVSVGASNFFLLIFS